MAGELALSPAQRSLVDKARAVQRAKLDKEAIKHTIEDRAQRHIEETKQRCRAQQHDRDARAQDRKLIIRHVGEELARVAQRSDHPHSTKKLTVKAGGRPTGLRQPQASNNDSRGESSSAGHAGASGEDDEYDEERFGPNRRPPRPRKPNLWLQVFEKEKEEVEHEEDEKKRRRLAAAAQFRIQLAQQEAIKAAQRKVDQQREDEYAKLQTKQIAEWKELQKIKDQQRQEAAEHITKQCKQDVQASLEQQTLAQKKREQQELKTLARYQAMMEEEKRQKELKKQREKDEVAKVAQANAMQLAIKQKEKLFEQEEEMRLQREYEQKLAMQEAARQRELQEILEKQSRKVKMALLNVKSAEEKAREDEERAAIVQAQVRQREEAERLRREQKRQEVIRVQARALQEQKAEKKVKFQQETKEEEAYAKQFKADYLEWVAKEKLKKVHVQQRNNAHEQLVVRQMRDDTVRHSNEDKYGMTKREMALNAELLRKIGVARPPSDAAPR